MTLAPRRLPSEEAHVWSVELDVPQAQIPHLERVLSLHERTCALRFRREVDRVRYTVAHARLREILSAYEGIAPGKLQFDQNKNGKPHLLRDGQPSRTYFSLSHSHRHALVAVAIGQPIGVDIERINSDAGVLSIADRVFSQQEQDALRACPSTDRLAHFFHVWVCKEAYVKARGGTILDRLPSFVVGIDSAGRARLVSDARDPTAPRKWKVELLETVPGFTAAVAARTIREPVLVRAWP